MANTHHAHRNGEQTNIDVLTGDLTVLADTEIRAEAPPLNVRVAFVDRSIAIMSIKKGGQTGRPTTRLL
ncbi:MAG: hypothetical protein ABIR70_04930 [Bryobacteraceae bacterium]